MLIHYIIFYFGFKKITINIYIYTYFLAMCHPVIGVTKIHSSTYRQDSACVQPKKG